MRDEYTHDGAYGYTLWKPETEAPHDHGGKPVIRVARDPGMDLDQIEESVRKTLDRYPEELGLSREEVEVGKSGRSGVAVGPIPGSTPYIEVYVPKGKEVYRIDVYGTELDAEAKELLAGIRFGEPRRSIASLDVPAANSGQALYPEGGPGEETLGRTEIESALGDAATSPSYTTSSSSTSSSSVPRYGEKRIYEGCYLSYSRFWLQTQHDAAANAASGDGIRRGFVLGRPNYWGQYSHGDVGYGRCKSDYYTNDKFAVDYPYNRGTGSTRRSGAARSSSPATPARTGPTATSSSSRHSTTST